jgi:hypothetical protein
MVVGVVVVVQPGVAGADSPLTSGVFHTHYPKVPGIASARLNGQLNNQMARFLMGRAPNHRKAALINALGWKISGQDNARHFATALAKRKRVAFDRLQYRHFSTSQLFVLGYLLAMDDYFKMKPLSPGATGVLGASARQLLDRAAKKARRNFTIQFIRALVESQDIMSKSFCKVYLTVQKVLKRFPSKRRKMKPAAVAAVMKYIYGYRSYCIHLRPKYDPRYNQIYDIASYKKWIVTGSQAGVVVWEPVSGRIHALKRAYISYRLLSTKKYLWVGSYTRVLRYDGRTFKEYLKRPGARGIKVLRGFKGAVMALDRRDLYRYDPTQDKFLSAGVLGTSVYDLIYRKNGQRWYLDFMRSLLCVGCGGSTTTIYVRSNAYPGRDPRRFHEDPTGRLWVADFRGGFFYWKPKRKRFVRVSGIADKGSDVAVDVKKRRTWLLHYTGGLYLKRPGKALASFSLGNVRYMRKLHLDPRGGLWVASWNGLLKVRLVGSKIKKRMYAVAAPKKKARTRARKLYKRSRKRNLPRAYIP